MEIFLKPIAFSILKTTTATIDENINYMDTEDITTTTKSYISLLPSPILGEILSRIPAKTVFGCMTISKPWLSLVDNVFFAKQHFSRAQSCPLVVFFNPKPVRKSPRIIMHLVEGQSVSDIDPMIGNKSKLISRIEISDWLPLFKNVNVTSCEGVVCFASGYGGIRDYAIICNPTRGEYAIINVDGPNEEISFFIGLGFSKVDKKFKMLRFTTRTKCIDASVPVSWWPEVSVVGSTIWRTIEKPLMDGIFKLSPKGYDVINVDGMIYWRCYHDPYICCFDFDDDVFRVIQLPLDIHEMSNEIIKFVTSNMHMGVSKNSLCLSLVCPNDGHVELWIIPRNGIQESNWIKILDIETTATQMEHNGELLTRGHYKPIKNLVCGKVLLHDWRDTFLIYDPVTKSESFFRVLEDSNLKKFGTHLNFQVVPHKPSLVSLRDSLNMEDENVKVLRIYPRKPRINVLELRRSSRLREKGRGRA